MEIVYSSPIYFTIYYVTRDVILLIVSLAWFSIINLRHVAELKFQYCDTRYFTQAVVTDKFIGY